MKLRFIPGFILSLAISSFAAERNTLAKIIKVETYTGTTVLWLQHIENDPLPSVASHFPASVSTGLILTDGSAPAEERKFMLATALTALTTGVNVRFKWDDPSKRIIALMAYSE